MALFKILKGLLARLPNTSKLGYAYYTTDKGKFYIFNSATLRRTLNPDIKITIGDQTKTSTTLSPEVTFDLASIGAAAAGHNHDNRYLKLSGGTMTGDIIFTNKDANRLIWTDEDKKVSTTGHYATSDRVAINSTSEPGYNLLVNGTTHLQGLTATRTVRPEETKKYSLGTNDYEWSALYVSGNAQIDGSIKNLAVNGGIYWNPYVESTGDASDAASIEVIKAGVAGGTLLRIQQQNDANDVVNIVTNATTGFKHNGHTVWDDTNDGPGSGADADLLDGCHGSYLPSANTYVRREDNGYTKQNYILYTPNKGLNPSIGSFVVTNTGDNYLRFATKTNVVNQLAESPGTLINNNGHTYSITVTGDANTYYPVVIDTPLEKEAINYVSIWKNLGSQTATYTGNHSNGTSSMWLIYEVRTLLWDGNGGYLKCWYYSMPYADLCANTISAGNSAGKLVVYLRGGTTSYNISTTYKSGVSVYYQETNIGENSYPFKVSPTTNIGNRGKCSTTFLGYGDVVGNADTSTIPLGFASRDTNTTWGDQTGTTITCWNLSSGGSVEFRRNNPSDGKLSIKVNGRFYGNEGSYPAMLIRWRNNYWGLGNPDGDDSDWIRTTVNGLIPFQSGGQGNGNSALGTSSWYFKEAFIDTVNGTNLYLRGQTGNRLIWLDGSKMLDTTGHYASGSKIAVNSTEEPGYNLYVNGNSYFTGTIRAKTAGSSWIDGLKGTNRSALLVTDATDSDSYWPWISHHNISSKRYFSLGQLANSIYLIGTTDTRTTNGYDYGWQFDFSNGVMTVPGNIQPVSTNTQTLGTSSLRWAKVYIGTADTYGSTTKGVYWNAGVPTAMTYELKSTVNDGTATRIAYYSGTNAVSSGSIVTDGSYLHDVSSLYVTKNDWKFALGHNYTNQDTYLSPDYGGIRIQFLNTDVGQTYTLIRPDFISIGKKASDGNTLATIWIDNASGSITANGTIKALNNIYTSSIYASNWFRSQGNSGWYSLNYGGGWYMTDSTWIRTYGDKNVYQNAGIIRTDGTFQVGDSGNKFYANNSGNGYFSNTLGIAGVNTNYKLYVVGLSWISGTLWNQHLYPEATKTYDLGSASYIWNNIYGNQLWLYNLLEGNSDITDNTEILTSYASDNGFDDSNAVGKVYKRDAIHLYNYIISKTTGSFYVKKAGDTMTGDLSFASIGDVATSAKISWNGSTNGADIYYQTTEADQGNLVLNTRDDANCYIRFAYNGAFKSYIRTSDGTYIGKLLGISDGSSWIDGQRYERGGFNLSDATNTANYWPWLRQTNTSSARWFSFGTLGNCFYMIGSSTGRTDNGYDHGLCYDISNGNLSGIKDIYTTSIYASEWFRSKGKSGWYSQDYGGGWWMTDSTWIRSYNNKSLYTGTGTIRSEREIQSTSLGGICQFRAIGGAYGVMLRNDGANTYILLTNAGDQYGNWNGLRPFRINNGSGAVYILTSLIYQHFTLVGNLYVGWNQGSSPVLVAKYGGTTASGPGNVITEARMKAAIAHIHGSDRRVKQNIRDLSIQTIKKIYMNFKPVRYEFKLGALADKYAPGERFGYIAQDMESSFLKYGVNPGLLVYHQHNIDKTSKLYSYLGECNLYTIDYENLHALHTLMIQLHDSLIELLKKQNKKLLQLIQLLNAKLDTLVVSHL